MVGTSLTTMGGISAVAKVYKETGLFRRWGVRYIASHTDTSRLMKIVFALRSFGTYFYLLLLGRAELVHIHSASRASFWRKSPFVVLARIFRVPCLFHLHGGGFRTFYYSECGSLRQWFIRRILLMTSEIVVLSEVWRQSISRIVPSARVSVLANPIVAPPEKAHSRDAQRYDVLYLGRVFESKGIYVLLDAVSRLKESFPSLKIGCAGDGDLREVALALERMSLADTVDILGWVDKNTRDDLLASSSILVLPSFAEGLPMSVLEAMASALPVVASAVGGIPDAIESGEQGILTVPGDVESLTNALETLLNDPDLRQRMGNAGRDKFLQMFSVDVVIPQLEQIYSRYGVVASET